MLDPRIVGIAAIEIQTKRCLDFRVLKKQVPRLIQVNIEILKVS